MFNALVIDDNDTTADTHRLVLEELDFNVVVCHTPAGGIKVMKNSPCYDLVLCDLSFPPTESAKANTDGLSVGEWLQSNKYPTESRVSSARYKDGDGVVRQSLDLFNGSLPPGSDVGKYIEAAEKAKQAKQERLENSILRAEPGIAKGAEKSLLRVHTLADTDGPPPFSEYVNQGYRVLVVQPETHSFPVGLPFFVWMKDLDEGVFLEVYGQPQLLAFADDLEAALAGLNEVLHSMYAELENGELSGPLSRVKQFLSQVYDADREQPIRAVE